MRFIQFCVFAFCFLAIAAPARKAFAADCTNPAEIEGTMIYNEEQNVFQYCNGTDWIAIGSLNPGAGGSGCTGPAGVEAEVIYNNDYHVLQYCDGDDWIAMGYGGTCTACAGGGGGTVACTIGEPVGSGICGGQIEGKDIIVAPSGCANNASSAAQCSGTDQLMSYAGGNFETNTEIHLADAVAATNSMIASGVGGIASYCRGLTLDGRTWHAPSVSDLSIILKNKNTGSWTNGAFSPAIYWTVNEIDYGNAHTIDMTAPPLGWVLNKDNTGFVDHYIRCITYAIPGAFSFSDQVGVALSTPTMSDIVQITGLTGNVATSITGGGSPQYRICSDSGCSTEVQTWTSAAATIQNSQYLQLRLSSSASYSTMLSATMTVGPNSDQWDVTTTIDCAAAGGQSVGGGCWFLGSTSQSCNTVCGNQSLAYDATGQSYANNPNTANCQAVLDALSAVGSGAPATTACSYGCAARPSNSTRRLCTSPTTATASSANYTRACACQ